MIRALQHQLEEKSATIAHLVTKLHHTQKYLQKSLEAGTKPSLAPPSLLPRPKEPPSFKTGRITRRLRRSVTSLVPPTDDTANTPALLPSPFPGHTAVHSRSDHTVSGDDRTVLRSKDPVLPPINDTSRPSHKRYVLAKSQGLSSAPCSLRLVDYKRPSTEATVEECEEGSSEQGKLLVKCESHPPLPQIHHHHRTI